ncbi:unnamed protein product [Linum tenue]|uniref:Uncharacterized protein n=1 Tax=Linum tenue TaxID=586396 RepID=A0AAV0MPW3_9ROSI|nr:unnamed protein product [Linum tenue]
MLSISSGDEEVSKDRPPAKGRAGGGGAGRGGKDDDGWDGGEPDCWKRVDEAEGLSATVGRSQWRLSRPATAAPCTSLDGYTSGVVRWLHRADIGPDKYSLPYFLFIFLYNCPP